MPFSRNINAYPSHFLAIAEELWSKRHIPSILEPIYQNLPSATCVSTRHRLNAFFKLLANDPANQHLPYAQVMRYFELTIVPAVTATETLYMSSVHNDRWNLSARHRDYLYKNINPRFLTAAPSAEARARAILDAPPPQQEDFKAEETDALFAKLMGIESNLAQPAKPTTSASPQLEDTCDHNWIPFPNDASMEICTKCPLGRPKPIADANQQLLPKAIDNMIQSTDNTNIGESPPTTEKPNPGDTNG